ncbi:MAG: VOC family protein, partial [Pseudomonadota bacterium]
CQVGALNIELIQQKDDRPSVYRDIYPPGASGFHHICLFTDDLKADVASYNAMGFETALEANDDVSGLKFAYVDAFRSLNCMIELVENGPTIQAIYSKVREGAEEWDGRNLKRSLY